jgi:hypothetical protein
MERSMSLVQSLRPTTARLAGLAGLLALPLLVGCVYDDGYYDPSSSYGYGYDYGPDYGYGGYGYNYGYYGNPCWPYGCNDWNHNHRHHHWDDNDNDNDNSHQHHHGTGSGMSGGPRFDPGGPPDKPRYVVPPSANNDAPKQQPRSGRPWPSFCRYGSCYDVPQQKDSKN